MRTYFAAVAEQVSKRTDQWRRQTSALAVAGVVHSIGLECSSGQRLRMRGSRKQVWVVGSCAVKTGLGSKTKKHSTAAQRRGCVKKTSTT